MFEIGFLELVMLGTIGLLVVGPSRLPGLVRTVGVWVGRAQRMVGQVRADIEREVRADELRKAAKEYSPAAVVSDMRKEVEDFASEVSTPVERDAEEAGPEKPEAGKAEPEKTEAVNTGAEKAETGKPESSDGGPGEATEPAESAAAEPDPDPDTTGPEASGAAGAEGPEPASRPRATHPLRRGMGISGRRQRSRRRMRSRPAAGRIARRRPP